MDKSFWNRPELDISRPKTLLYAAIWLSAGLVGVTAVLYARLIAGLQADFFRVFHKSPVIVSIAGPFFFVAATWLVREFAPDAKGSGIPQILAAIDQARESQSTAGILESDRMWQSSLISIRTAFIKILSSSVGILGSASIGREGPTVQVAAAGFTWIGKLIKKYAPDIDLQTFLIAGAAAGVAAAFNTPIAGIAFALEEIADGFFGPFRQLVMLAVIIAGIIAQGLAGNYLYFGQPVLFPSTAKLLFIEAIVLGTAGGLLGGLFGKLLTDKRFTRLPEHWVQRAFITGVICSAIGYFTHGDTSGSGYEVTRKYLEAATPADVSVMLPIYKFATTVFSYLSGMAGGIFSPCLSVGAALGISLAKIAHFDNFRTCALIGMVAFFSGAVRAPLTAVIIVMEMTNQHILVIPFMIAAYLSHSVGRRIMPVPLYRYLAEKHIL